MGNQAPALDLIAISTAADRDCEPVFQSMKVCNGDYGPTPWVGVNEMILEDDKIIMSRAKMNDYYLSSASEAKKQYTMCHEIGHGFGLTHTDEDHLNANTGNCLDYTDDPEENIVSGIYNWERLETMYGLTVKKTDEEEESKDKDKNPVCHLQLSVHGVSSKSHVPWDWCMLILRFRHDVGLKSIFSLRRQQPPILR